MAEADLRLVLHTVAEQTSEALRRVNQQTAQTNTLTRQLASSLVSYAAGFISVAAAAQAATAVFGASINAQRESERVTRATAAAYGSNAQQFTRFANALSQQTGFTSQAILEAALSARTLTANYGLTIAQTQELIRASADLARVRGIGVAEAFERVQSAIRGEAEASEFLGLTLNDTYIKNNALNGSVKNTFERMTDAQKAQIRYDEVLKQTATFKGLATASINSLDGSMLRAESSANKLAIAFGKIASPATIGGLQLAEQAMKDLAITLDVLAKNPWASPADVVGAIKAGTTQPSLARNQVSATDLQLAANLYRPSPVSGRVLPGERIVGASVQERANMVRAGEHARKVSLQEIAYLDQRDAAIRDLLSAQREEVALKEQLTRMEREQGAMAQRRVQYELASIAAQQRALPAQQALQDTERAVERARLVLGIRGTSLEERQGARATIRGAERNILPGQRLAAFDVETGLIGAQRAETAFDLNARLTQITIDQALAGQKTLVDQAAARVDAQQQMLGQIMQQAMADGFAKRPPTQITLQVLGPDGQVSYEELIEATDQAGLPPVIRISGVRR
jgi:hypothetical protein